jgi:hypothetical protein
MLNNETPCRLWLALAAILLSLGVCANSYAMPKGDLNKQLLETMAKVREGKTSNARTDAAERLATLTRRINPDKVDDATLTEMVSLLDTEEDSVRLWVATALGNIGPRAKAAVPKLLKILPEVDCLRRNLTSAPAVRLALKRMGEKVPPEPNCEGKWH